MSDLSYDIYAAMQEGKPLASYKKVILGKVVVKVLNPFTGNQEEIILKGDPNNSIQEEDCIIDIWDTKALTFFTKMNRFHLEKGNIIPFERKEKEPVYNYNAMTDDEIRDLLNKEFYTFRKILNSVTEENTLLRILRLAEEMNKSVKIIKRIEDRISEIQGE